MSFLGEFVPSPDLDLESIRKLAAIGFRRWYERQLIESHLWLTLCIVCMVAFAAGLELLGGTRNGGQFFVDGLIIFASGLIGWLSWRKYACTMVRAELVGGQAVCGECKHYGFRIVVAPEAVDLGQSLNNNRDIRVRCTRCAHQWQIHR